MPIIFLTRTGIHVIDDRGNVKDLAGHAVDQAIAQFNASEEFRTRSSRAAWSLVWLTCWNLWSFAVPIILWALAVLLGGKR